MSLINVYKHPDYSMTFDGNDFFLKGLNLLVPFSENIFNCIDDFENSDIIPVFIDAPREEIINFLKKYDLTNKLFVDVSICIHSEYTYTTEYINRKYEIAKDFFNELPENNRPKFCFLHNLLNVKDSNKKMSVYYTDYLFNRQISLFVEKLNHIVNADKQEPRNHWYPDPMQQEIYDLPDLDVYCSEEHLQNLINSSNRYFPLKMYLSPCSIRNGWIYRRYYTGFNKDDPGLYTTHIRDFLRSELITRLQRYPGYVGDVTGGIPLLGQGMNKDKLEQFMSGMGISVWPIHNVYYTSSVVSIYTETVTMSHENETVRTITEKTWDPLIKGHFILPFGYQGMMKDLTDFYGFLLPDWIDYSYDKVNNDLLRWQRYIAAMEKLLSMPSIELFRLKMRDKEILKHNRNVFFKTKYKHPISHALMNWAKDNSSDPKNMLLVRKILYNSRNKNAPALAVI